MSKRTRHLIYAVLLATAITLICASGVLRTADLWVNDLLYQREIYVDNDIVIIVIDDKEIKNAFIGNDLHVTGFTNKEIQETQVQTPPEDIHKDIIDTL